MKIIINGRFLTQNITGVQRFAHEIVKELDKIVKKDKIMILTPKNILFKNLRYENIEIRKVGILKGHLWEQLELPYYTWKNKGKLLSLCNCCFFKSGYSFNKSFAISLSLSPSNINK